MKNILVYISPSDSFGNEIKGHFNDAEICAKVQIENSLKWGWDQSNILLYTNFEFEYNGIKATVLDGVEFFDRKPQASKINAIARLFEKDLILDGELYWFHDLDAFQVCPTPSLFVKLGHYDIAVTDYGTTSKWSTGVIYFKKGAKDLFYKLRDTTYALDIDEETALMCLTKFNRNVRRRVARINKTFNFTPRQLPKVYSVSDKPIKVIHFHLMAEVSRVERKRQFDVFKGENELGIQFIPDYLIKMLNNHGIK